MIHGIDEIATSEVVTTDPDAGVSEALDMMDDQKVGSVVVTEGDEPVGIVTDRMIAMGLRNAETIDDVPVEDVMSGDLVTVSEDHTHFDALQTMRESAIRRLPIVDEDDTLTGIITLDDVLVVTAAEMSNVSDIIEQQTDPL